MWTAEDLVQIHRNVWNKFTYTTDKNNYGSDEHWVIPVEFMQSKRFTGDCEDFAMCCRTLCRQQNIPSQLAICLDETGEHHCVLHVEGYILDNRYNKVMTVDQLTNIGYKWIAISGYNIGDPWHRVLL